MLKVVESCFAEIIVSSQNSATSFVRFRIEEDEAQLNRLLLLYYCWLISQTYKFSELLLSVVESAEESLIINVLFELTKQNFDLCVSNVSYSFTHSELKKRKKRQYIIILIERNKFTA